MLKYLLPLSIFFNDFSLTQKKDKMFCLKQQKTDQTLKLTISTKASMHSSENTFNNRFLIICSGRSEDETGCLNSSCQVSFFVHMWRPPLVQPLSVDVWPRLPPFRRSSGFRLFVADVKANARRSGFFFVKRGKSLCRTRKEKKEEDDDDGGVSEPEEQQQLGGVNSLGAPLDEMREESRRLCQCRRIGRDRNSGRVLSSQRTASS